MATVAETLVDTLAAAGVDTVYGLPGGEVVEILDVLRRRQLRFVFVHNESSAVFMADAMARVTGKPGVALATLGPGATNGVAGVAHAHLDRSPVLWITAQKPDAMLPDYTHQVIDQQALFRPITKGSFKLSAQNVGSTTAQALALAQAGRPGPVHLQISNEDATQTVDERRTPMAEKEPSRHEATQVARARQILEHARKPVLVVGLGVEPERPYDALRQLAEAANAPVIVLPKAKGALADDHPLAAGVIGLTRSDPVYEILDEADAIVAVGMDVVELVKPWAHPAPLIWIAPWSNVDPVIPAAVELVGAQASVLHQLAEGSFNTVPDWGAKRVAAFRGRAAASLPAPAEGRLSPQQVLETLRRHLPRGGLLAVDVGSHKIHSSLDWPTYTPNRFLLSNGLSCMGYALPAAIGASFALPGEPVVCLTGDAGMAMVMGELAVLAQWQLPVVVVVLNDNAIDLIRSHQVKAGKPVFGTEFPSPSFAQIAAAYGIAAARVHSEWEYSAALQAALVGGKPMLIEVMLDPANYPTTPKKVK